MKIPLLIQLEKGKHSLRIVKGNWLSLFFHAEKFCPNKVKQQSPPTPFIYFLARKVCLISFYLQHRATNLLRMFAQGADRHTPSDLTESSSLNIYSTSHLATKTSEAIFKWGWKKGAAGQDLSVQTGSGLAVATNPPPNGHCMKCLVMWTVSPSSLFSLWSVT